MDTKRPTISGTWVNPAHLRRCEGKIGYKHEGKAMSKAKAASYREGALIHAYECPDCGFFHIGHADISQQMARLMKGETLDDLNKRLQTAASLAGKRCESCGTALDPEKAARHPELKYCKPCTLKYWENTFCSPDTEAVAEV